MDGMQSGDAALVEAWRRGDPEAVPEVVRTHAPAMLRVALALCPRVEDAEEVVQDALLLAHRSLGRFDARRGGLRVWLVGVTANRARQVRRGQARYGGLLARVRREPYASAEPPSVHEDLAFARRQLASLPAREREAFVLVEMEELTSTEAARVMRITASTVRVLVSRARGRLHVEPAFSPADALRAEGRGR